MNKFYLFSLFILLFIDCFQKKEEWVSFYNGPVSDIDIASKIVLDREGNIYITGWSYGADYDFATLKYDSSGKLLWAVRYNGEGDSTDIPRDMAIDKLGYIYITGISSGKRTGLDYVLIKYSSNGEEEWVQRYTSKGMFDDEPSALCIDNQGNIYVTGASLGDFTTIKYTPEGKIEWIAKYDGPAKRDDWASDVSVNAQGNVYVTGSSPGKETGFDYATVKYDKKGKQLWVARYDGPIHSWDRPLVLEIDNKGNVYVAGESKGKGTWFDCATVKYSADGKELWVSRYNNAEMDSTDVANAIAVDADGSVYIAGASVGKETGFDYIVISYAPNGREKWVYRYTSKGTENDLSKAIKIDENGNIYVTGESAGDFATILLDPKGREIWSARFNGSAGSADGASDLVLDKKGNLFVTGAVTQAGARGVDFATLKYPAFLFR